MEASSRLSYVWRYVAAANNAIGGVETIVSAGFQFRKWKFATTNSVARKADIVTRYPHPLHCFDTWMCHGTRQGFGRTPCASDCCRQSIFLS